MGRPVFGDGHGAGMLHQGEGPTSLERGSKEGAINSGVEKGKRGELATTRGGGQLTQATSRNQHEGSYTKCGRKVPRVLRAAMEILIDIKQEQ